MTNEFLIVDLATLYARIHAGNIVTEDGYKVNGRAGGNFSSGDEILYPFAIGNAVIANEIIKVLNAGFRSKIALINVTEFAGY